ncbi:50S ribosomal protein L11 methyltransferase [Parafilimonas sp.]|uniref:50S ribosomal protein L11 methyltransferase n=1 Tax=Parafilimonas sp. TaxID=1969739 RepID=UPI0039E41B4A
MNYLEISFESIPEEKKEILIALLSEMHFEGFEEQPACLKAFISKNLFDEEMLQQLTAKMQLDYATSELPDVNWNSVWESNFQPVVIGNCALRASFHQPIKNIQYEIVITPKMSFGTGHHATTFMMIQQMQAIDFNHTTVLDFGTGTGVLAILAHKLGAAKVVAIDNDSFSIENAAENFSNNHINDIELKMADNAKAQGSFDIILANITRNIIQENFRLFNLQLTEGGLLLLSGLLKEDEKSITVTAVNSGFQLKHKLEKGNWICLLFTKNK